MSEELPAGWQRVPLGQLITGIDAGKNVRCEERPPGPGERGIVKISAVTWGEFDPTEAKTAPAGMILDEGTRIHAGDLLMSRANTLELVGATVVVGTDPGNLYLSDKVLRLRAEPEVARWLNLFLRSTEGRAEIEARATGNQLSMRNIGQVAIQSIQVPLPPAAEQRRIVARSEALRARTRRARVELERAAVMTDRHWQRVLASAFTDGEGAPPVRVGSLLAEPPANGISVRGSDEPPGTPALRLDALREGELDLSRIRYIDIPATAVQRLRVRAGDFLVSRGNGSLHLLARGVFAPDPVEDMVFPDTMIRLRFRPERVLPAWLRLAWSSPVVRSQIEAKAKTTAGIWKVSQTDLESVELRLPSLEHQSAIASRVHASLSKTATARRETARALALLGRLEAAVLARAFHGELVPQDTADEPASALLARLSAAQPSEPRRRGRRAA